MKNTQNQKISQIKNETLVVGIDVAKETHYARAFDYRGIELARLLKFSKSRCLPPTYQLIEYSNNLDLSLL